MAKKPFASSDVDLNLEKEARKKDLRNRLEDMDRNVDLNLEKEAREKDLRKCLEDMDRNVDLNLEKEAREKDLRKCLEDMDRNGSGISSCVSVNPNEPQPNYPTTSQSAILRYSNSYKPVEQNKPDSPVNGLECTPRLLPQQTMLASSHLYVRTSMQILLHPVVSHSDAAMAKEAFVSSGASDAAMANATFPHLWSFWCSHD